MKNQHDTKQVAIDRALDAVAAELRNIRKSGAAAARPVYERQGDHFLVRFPRTGKQKAQAR